MIRERAPVFGSLLLAIVAMVAMAPSVAVEEPAVRQHPAAQRLIDELNRAEAEGRVYVRACTFGAR